MTCPPDPASHRSLISDQFTRQAELFARAPALHDAGALDALVQAARPSREDVSLDVACGPGTVVAAFAAQLRHATGLDATEAMLDQARELAASRGLANVSWRHGDVYALPFDDDRFDIVSCRFAFHHFEAPERAFAEMVRVCKSGGRVVLCDAVASDDPEKAAAFNAMERYRDPSTVGFRNLAYLADLFAGASLPEPVMSFYHVPVELNALLRLSFPVADDCDGLRAMIVNAVDGDRMGVNARWDGDRVRFEYAAAILAAVKP
jgi:ubiquinone/menaquinone biosynthesis C-methylase UbiE